MIRSSAFVQRVAVWFSTLLLIAGMLRTTREARAQDRISSSAGEVRQLGTFLDGVIARQMAAHHVPGAVCVVVKDGQVVLARGYGLADLERAVPMDPQRTVLPVASISKLVTATAVMQLVDEGKVGLHDDVRPWLRRLGCEPPAGAPAVTLAHLLTHTAGLEPRFLGMATRDVEEVLSASDYLRQCPPRWALPPGQFSVYSNESINVAAAVLEQVTAERFERYVQRRLLGPLAMGRSSFRPESSMTDRATGYQCVRGHRQPVPRTYVRGIAAAGLTSTAGDMAHFMIAHLEGGRYGGQQQRILSEQALRQMHRRQFAYRPDWPGCGLGFYERPGSGGPRVVEHGGAWFGFTSKMALVPDERLGIFVAYNCFDLALIDGVVAELLARYYPQQAAKRPMPARQDAGSLGRFAGFYRPVGSSHGTIEKCRLLFHDMRVMAEPDQGTLRIESKREAPWQVQPLGDLLFQCPQDGREIAFRIDGDGQRYLLLGTEAHERVPWYQAAAVHRWLFVIFAGLFGLWTATAAGAEVLRYCLRWRFAAMDGAGWLATLVCGLHTLFVAGLLLAVRQMPLAELT